MKKVLLFLVVIAFVGCSTYHGKGLYGPKNVKKWQKEQLHKQRNTPK